MSEKKKKKSTESSVVTMVEDLYKINTFEISEAQNNEQDELILDRDLEEEKQEEEPAESLDSQMDKLAQAIQKQAQQAEPTDIFVETFDRTAELAAQIAEDRALEEQIRWKI
jgi:hypothetical protein